MLCASHGSASPAPAEGGWNWRSCVMQSISRACLPPESLAPLIPPCVPPMMWAHLLPWEQQASNKKGQC